MMSTAGGTVVVVVAAAALAAAVAVVVADAVVAVAAAVVAAAVVAPLPTSSQGPPALGPRRDLGSIAGTVTRKRTSAEGLSMESGSLIGYLGRDGVRFTAPRPWVRPCG